MDTQIVEARPSVRPRPLYAVTLEYKGNGSVTHRTFDTEQRARAAWDRTVDGLERASSIAWIALTVERPEAEKGYRVLGTMGSPRREVLVYEWAHVDDEACNCQAGVDPDCGSRGCWGGGYRWVNGVQVATIVAPSVSA